ncbi:MAG: hypothetical protein KatS3mg075_065 [Meiothermus sp.]|nr:MAG: hypothetical protein KatS3mg075_065 [Meiothermus sp.]
MTQARSRIRVPWLWLVVALVLAGLGGAAYWFLRPKPTSTAPAIETATVQRGVFRVSVSGPGTLEAVQSLAVKPAVNGTVLRLPNVGDRVQKGQLVVELDPTNYNRALENARLALQKAQANLDKLRADQAEHPGHGNRQNIASAEVAFANARRDLEAARTNLEATQKLFDLGGASAQSLQSARDAYAKAQASLEIAQVNLNTARQALALAQQRQRARSEKRPDCLRAGPPRGQKRRGKPGQYQNLCPLRWGGLGGQRPGGEHRGGGHG